MNLYLKFLCYSISLKCNMKFGLYLPPDYDTNKVPVIYWLSGLTCTEQNFMTKAGAQKYASKYNVILVMPDTSPSNEIFFFAFIILNYSNVTQNNYFIVGGVNIPGEDDSYDFGSGAGFYVDATQEPWNSHYNMYTYVTSELPEIINSNFPADPERQSIMGHR